VHQCCSPELSLQPKRHAGRGAFRPSGGWDLSWRVVGSGQHARRSAPKVAAERRRHGAIQSESHTQLNERWNKTWASEIGGLWEFVRFLPPPPHCDHSSTITLIRICTTLTIALHFNKRWHALLLLEKQQLLIHYQKYEMLLRGWTKLKHFYNCWPLWGTYEISSNCCSTCRAMMFRWAAYAQLLKQYGREWWIS